MQLIDEPWFEPRRDGATGSYSRVRSGGSAPTGQTEGMVYRRLASEWAASHSRMRRKPQALVAPAESMVSRLLDGWSRVLQMVSLGVAICGAIFAAAHVLAAAAGLMVVFVGLAAMFFGNFAAYRRGDPAHMVGPTVAMIGTWGCFVVAAAIGLNALLGA